MHTQATLRWCPVVTWAKGRPTPLLTSRRRLDQLEVPLRHLEFRFALTPRCALGRVAFGLADDDPHRLHAARHERLTQLEAARDISLSVSLR